MKTLFITLFLSVGLWAQIIVPPHKYTFPKVKPLIAAISTSFVGAPNGVWAHIKIPLKNRKLKNRKDDERIHFRYFWPSPHKDNKELVYILTGFGSDVKSEKANYLARQLTLSGFHTIVLPSIFTRRFIVAASTEGVVGEFNRDAKDYLKMMKEAYSYLQKNLGLKLKKKHMIGYSYGGLTAAFVARIDKNSFFNLSKEILINPPTNLLDAAKTVDNFNLSRLELGKYPFFKVVMKSAYLSFLYQRYEPTLESYKSYISRLNLTDRQSKALVGWSLTSTLPDVAESVLDVLNYDHGDLRGINRPSKKEIEKINLSDYMNKIVLPYGKINHRPHDTVQSMGKRNSLYVLTDYFRNNPNIYVIHNKDDFLINSQDIRYFSKNLGDRFILFPWGGHLGNFWHDQNMTTLVSILKNKDVRSSVMP